MPIQLKLKPINPVSRLHWLNSPDDFLKDASLINVEEPKTRRKWTVLHEVVAWRQWAMRNGDRRLERTTWFRLQSLLVKVTERDALIGALTEKMVIDDTDIPKIEMPWDAFVGEYHWHPVYRDIESWAKPWDELPVAVQPLVSSYRAERGSYDFSIEESFEFDLPCPGLVKGLNLHLSNGRELSYADSSGTVRFFDPSIKEAGPSAALVDSDAFFNFLNREGLTAVWTIGGLKNAHGGRRQEGWGGERLFSSVFWLTESGFERRDRFEDRKPSRDQVKRLMDEEENGESHRG